MNEHKAILGYSQADGHPVALVESKRQPGLVWHIVDMDGRCDCAGFRFRSRCSHTSIEISRKPAAADRVAALPPVSDYARREGWTPPVVRFRMPRPA